MTAIVKNRVEAPPLARAGLALPGLGHLLCGDVTSGLGNLVLVAICAWAAVAGFGRLDHALFAEAIEIADRVDAQNLGAWWWLQRVSWHGVAALVGWGVAVVLLWRNAWVYANPRELSPEERGSFRHLFALQFGRNRTGLLGLYGVLALGLVVLFAPLVAHHGPDVIDAAPKFAGPSWEHPMGSDQFGRDSFARVLYGGRISLTIGFVAVAIAASLGTLVGAVSGFFGGWIDRLLMWVVDLLLSLPRLVLLIAIVGIVRVSGPARLYLLVTILGLTGWMGVSRIVRSQVLSLREQEFVQAARALGLSQARILLRHVVPNALAPVIVYASLAIGTTILSEAGLSFLGLGVTPPTSTWGTLVADGKDSLRLAPWVAIFPGLFICWAVMTFNLLGDGLRDALDPKLRGL